MAKEGLCISKLATRLATLNTDVRNVVESVSSVL